MPDEEIVFTTNFELNVTINEEGNIKADYAFTYDNNKITYLTCKAKYDCKEENELIIDDNDTFPNPQSPIPNPQSPKYD